MPTHVVSANPIAIPGLTVGVEYVAQSQSIFTIKMERLTAAPVGIPASAYNVHPGEDAYVTLEAGETLYAWIESTIFTGELYLGEV